MEVIEVFMCLIAAIGLGVGNVYHEGSKAALGTQGTLNAVAAGILLYNGIADLMIPGKLQMVSCCTMASRTLPFPVKSSWYPAAQWCRRPDHTRRVTAGILLYKRIAALMISCENSWYPAVRWRR